MAYVDAPLGGKLVNLGQLLNEIQVLCPTAAGCAKLKSGDLRVFWRWPDLPEEGARDLIIQAILAHVPLPPPKTIRQLLREALQAAGSLAEAKAAFIDWIDRGGGNAEDAL